MHLVAVLRRADTIAAHTQLHSTQTTPSTLIHASCKDCHNSIKPWYSYMDTHAPFHSGAPTRRSHLPSPTQRLSSSLSLSLPKRSSLRLVVEYNHTGRTINGNDELHVVDGRQLVQ